MAKSESHMSAVCRILAEYNAARPSTPTMEANKKLAAARTERLRGPSFRLFPRLPVEIRRMVFDFAAHNTTKARLMIYVKVQVKGVRGEQSCRLIFKVLIAWDKKLDAAVRDLALSEVNRESRAAYSKVFNYKLPADNGDETVSLLRLSESDLLYITNLDDFIGKIYNSQRYPEFPIIQNCIMIYFDNLKHLAIPYDYLRPKDPRNRGPVWSITESSFACFPNLKRLDLINEKGHHIFKQIDKKHAVLNRMEDYRDAVVRDHRKQRLQEGASLEVVEKELASEEGVRAIDDIFPEIRVQIRSWRGKVRIPWTLPGEDDTE